MTETITTRRSMDEVATYAIARGFRAVTYFDGGADEWAVRITEVKDEGTIYSSITTTDHVDRIICHRDGCVTENGGANCWRCGRGVYPTG